MCEEAIANCLARNVVVPGATIPVQSPVRRIKLGWSAFNRISSDGKFVANPLFGVVLDNKLTKHQAKAVFDAVFGDEWEGHHEAQLIADIIRYEYLTTT